MKKIININNAPKAIGPYSQAIIKDNLLFTSGQICIDPETNELNNKNFESEVNQVLKNIKNILLSNDITMDDVLKCNVYITDLNKFSIVNKVFKKYFIDQYPTRSTIEVNKLPLDVNIEIDVIACIKK